MVRTTGRSGLMVCLPVLRREIITAIPKTFDNPIEYDIYHQLTAIEDCVLGLCLGDGKTGVYIPERNATLYGVPPHGIKSHLKTNLEELSVYAHLISEHIAPVLEMMYAYCILVDVSKEIVAPTETLAQLYTPLDLSLESESIFVGDEGESR